MKTSLRKRFGHRIKELRQASGMSQEAFADRCGFARSYMSRIERGGANCSLDAIQTLADALSLKEVALFNEKDESPTPCFPDEEVPFAKDGSCFSKATFRPRTKKYCVGEKGQGKTKQFEKFEDALAYLRTMPIAKWWRPDSKGNWGLVSAVRWGKTPDVDTE